MFAVDAKLKEWLVSGFIVGLAPALVNGLLVAFTSVPLSKSWLIGGGGLLMLSVGLSVGALLDIPSASVSAMTKDWNSLLCVACIVGALLAYAVVACAQAFGAEVNTAAVAIVSLLVYVPSVYVSALCVARAERSS